MTSEISLFAKQGLTCSLIEINMKFLDCFRMRLMMLINLTIFNNLSKKYQALRCSVDSVVHAVKFMFVLELREIFSNICLVSDGFCAVISGAVEVVKESRWQCQGRSYQWH